MMSLRNNIYLIAILTFLIFLIPLLLGYQYGSINKQQLETFGYSDYQNLIEINKYALSNPDFENIYVPLMDAWRQSYLKSIEFFDLTRFTGVALKGHPISDTYNSLNFLSLLFDSPNAIYIKSMIYLTFLVIGQFKLLSILFPNISKNFIIIGATFLLLCPNNLYYLHWPGYLGVIALVPWSIYLAIKYLNSPSWINGIALIPIPILFWLINMAELIIYAALILSFLLVSYIFVHKPKPQLIIKLLLFLILGLVLTAPFIIESYEYSEQLLRQPESSLSLLERQPYLPKSVYQLIPLSGLVLPIQHVFQHSIFLTPLLGVGLLWGIATMRFSFVALPFFILIIFLFLGYIDVLLNEFEIYQKLSNQHRAVSILYIFISIYITYGLSEIAQSSYGRKIAMLGFCIIMLSFVILYMGIFLELVPKIIKEYYTHPIGYTFSLLSVFLALSLATVLVGASIGKLTPYVMVCFSFVLMLSHTDFVNIEKRLKPSPFSERALLVDRNQTFVEDASDSKRYLGGILYYDGLAPIMGYDTGITVNTIKSLGELYDAKKANYWNTDDEMSFAQFGAYWLPFDLKNFEQKQIFDKCEDLRKLLSKYGIGVIVTNFETDCGVVFLRRKDFKFIRFVDEIGSSFVVDSDEETEQSLLPLAQVDYDDGRLRLRVGNAEDISVKYLSAVEILDNVQYSGISYELAPNQYYELRTNNKNFMYAMLLQFFILLTYVRIVFSKAQLTLKRKNYT